MYEEVVFKIVKFECPKTQDTSTFLCTFMYEEVVFKIVKFERPKTQDTSTFWSTFMYKEVAITFIIVKSHVPPNYLHKRYEH